MMLSRWMITDIFKGDAMARDTNTITVTDTNTTATDKTATTTDNRLSQSQLINLIYNYALQPINHLFTCTNELLLLMRFMLFLF